MIRGAFTPSSVNEETRSVELVWTTGADVRRYDWRNGGYYWERLKVDEKSIDLSRLRNGAPLLAQHNQYSLSGQIGVIESARVEGGRGFAVVRFSKRDDVEPIWQDVKDGILRNVSVGYEQNKLRDTTEERDGIPVREVTRWTPHELSLVSIPADAGAQVREAPDHDGAAVDDTEDNTAMAHPNADTPTARDAATTATPTPPVSSPDAAAIRAAAEQAAQEAVRHERERVEAIHHAVTAARVPGGTELARTLVSEGVSADVARQRVLARLAEQAAPDTEGVPTDTRVHAGDGRRDAQFRQVIVDGLAFRCGGARPSDPEALRVSSRGILRLAEELLESGGRRTRNMSPTELARAAMATGDFTDIIADVAGRSLTRGYDAEVRTFAEVFRQAMAANFRPIERIKLSDVPALAAVAEGAAYTEVAFTEDKETYAVGKFGRRIGYTWEMMVNDDLDALSRIPAMLGAAAARLENDTVWGVLTANGDLADTDPLFNVTAGNESSAALDAAGLAAARLYLRTAETENGQPLNLQAEFLVVGPALENTAELLLAVLPEMTTTSRANIVAPGLRTRLKLVVEPRIAANNWYVLTAPTSIDTMEYAYLQGHERPTLTRDDPFSVDQVDMKVRHVIGAGAIDRRGMWHSDSTP